MNINALGKSLFPTCFQTLFHKSLIGYLLFLLSKYSPLGHQKISYHPNLDGSMRVRTEDSMKDEVMVSW